MAGQQQLSLKLLVDTVKDRVVFAEADRDFGDILLSFLTLPLGTIVRRLNKKSSLGSIDNLYESVESLDTKYLQTEACKSMLLFPVSASALLCEGLPINVDDTEAKSIYICPTMDCYIKNCIYSISKDSRCPCGKTMDFVKTWDWRNNNTTAGDAKKEVFIKEEVKLVVSDDLQVMEASTFASLSVLQKYGIKDGTTLKETTVNLELEKILKLLKRLLLSQMPLSEVFLRDIGTIDDKDAQKTYMKETILPELESDSRNNTELKKIKVKLLVSKLDNIVLYAEAGGDFIDLLLSFLTIPLGSVIKLLDQNSSVGCVDNLYRSIHGLDTGGCIASEERKKMLLAPLLAPHFACDNMLFKLGEMSGGVFRARKCSVCYRKGVASRCEHGKDIGTFKAVNPKLPNGGTEPGGGYTKGPFNKFMVTDDLVVQPYSPFNGIQLISKWNLPFNDVEEREVHLGEEQAAKLLKFSLISRKVLTHAFCFHVPYSVKMEQWDTGIQKG